jgi:hypothetical protein
MIVRYAILGVITAAGFFALIVHGPIAQDPRYHDFADRRRLLGISNFWNVVSNVPFLLIGLAGLRVLYREETTLAAPAPAYYAFFVSLICVSLGSAWYHLSPTNERLTWDRLPMALAFMAFLTIVIGERIDERVARVLLPGLLLFGSASVAHWHASERRGRGDLRLYLLVQFLPLILIAFITVLFPAPLLKNVTIWGMLAAYAAAKILEMLDRRIFAVHQWISGHTLKHLAAAAGLYMLVVAIAAGGK